MLSFRRRSQKTTKASWLGLAALLATTGVAAQPDTRTLRPMSSDRPDATESPFTVDAGHVQLELDFANFSRDRESGAETKEWEVAPFNLRFGVARDFELGVFLTPFHQVEEKVAGGPRERSEGVADPVLRAKWNLFGNDGGNLALGLVADLKFPIGARAVSNREWEGALLLPLSFSLGAGWEGAAMTGVEIVYSDAGRHRAVWINTITAGRDLTDRLGVFLELTSATGDGPHVATADAGLTFRANENLQFDVGVYRGLSHAATDITVFAGVARRW